jgi:hypothetical protein
MQNYCVSLCPPIGADHGRIHEPRSSSSP